MRRVGSHLVANLLANGLYLINWTDDIIGSVDVCPTARSLYIGLVHAYNINLLYNYLYTSRRAWSSRLRLLII